MYWHAHRLLPTQFQNHHRAKHSLLLQQQKDHKEIIQQTQTHETLIHAISLTALGFKMILMKPFISMDHVLFLMMLLTASRMDVQITSFLNIAGSHTDVKFQGSIVSTL
jgi:uncharacterized membrane protein YcfT